MTNRFGKLGDAELKHLLIELYRAPATFEFEARRALESAARQRGFDIVSVLQESRQAEQSISTQMSFEAAAKKRKRDRFYFHFGRVIGCVGLAAAVGIGILSVMAGHVGGIISALFTAACSLWFVFRGG
ncbi:hypothetical protein [Brevundimonas sp. KM4]|uniref:hypothetical protein n=1 Tax=Brevundimonas sp. KM4 TaxID=1628191 RepID=UPI000A7AA324|nr:hypothetical protein [Brevundimonas sp. KM4]